MSFINDPNALYQNRMYANYHHGPITQGSERELLEAIYRQVGELQGLSKRLEDLENMMVDVNAGIDEILTELTHNKKSDEEICRHSCEGCEGCDSPGDTANSG